MKILSRIKRKIDWKNNLEKRTSKELFALYSETKRINLEPQIFAGKLLFDRKYDIEKLKSTRENLINSLLDQFERKNGKTDEDIKRDNLLTEIFHKSGLGIIIFFILRKLIIETDFLSDFTRRDIIPIIGLLLSFLPLLNLKRSHEKAIERTEKKKQELESKIELLKKELRF